MKNIMALYKWLDMAVSGIRFGPDREAVRAELRAHVEDKTADFQSIFPDITPNEAQERALAEMGDAEELKISLARVHRPWLGWLWRLSQVLVYGALVLALITGIVALCLTDRFVWEDNAYQRKQQQRYAAVMEALFEDGTPSWKGEGERLSLCAPEAERRLGRAVVSVPKAAWWREAGEDVLYLQIQVAWDLPWEVENGVLYRFEAEDGQGVPLKRGGDGGVWAEDAGLFWRQNVLRIPSLPRDARQVKLRYLPGTNFELIVDLTREVEP